MAISKSWCGNEDNRWKLAPSLDLEAETKTDVSNTTRKDKPLKWLCQYNLFTLESIKFAKIIL